MQVVSKAAVKPPHRQVAGISDHSVEGRVRPDSIGVADVEDAPEEGLALQIGQLSAVRGAETLVPPHVAVDRIHVRLLPQRVS